MPQKPNKAGQMQNYVPAGNGDASGEYGDNATGSNKHFQVFSKENTDDTNQQKQRLYDGKEYTQNETENIIKEAMGYKKKSLNVVRVMEQLNGENINPEIKSLVLEVLDKWGFKAIAIKDGKGYYEPSSKTIHFESIPSEEDKQYFIEGQTFFHEVGHALDHTYQNGTLYSKDYKSKKYGKSMLEMKEEELTPDVIEKIINEYKEEEKELNKDIESLQKQYNELVEQVNLLGLQKRNALTSNGRYMKLEGDLNELFEDFYERDKLTYDEYKEKRNSIVNELENIKSNFKFKKQKELDNLSQQRMEIGDKLSQKYKENRGKLFKKYGDLSDMCQAISPMYKFCGGHDISYFVGSNKLKATEIFAEIQSALGTNKESLKLLEKYIPKTVEIYKEIIGGMKDGK